MCNHWISHVRGHILAYFLWHLFGSVDHDLFHLFEAAAFFCLQGPMPANVVASFLFYFLFVCNSVALASPEDQHSSQDSPDVIALSTFSREGSWPPAPFQPFSGFHLSTTITATKPQVTQWQVKEGCNVSFRSKMELHAC